MSKTCDRLSKCYYNFENEKYERLIFPKNIRPNEYVYDGEINYSHSPIFDSKNYAEYYTEMKDKYKEPYYFMAGRQGLRRNQLRKFYLKQSINDAFDDIATIPEVENYVTEYASNFSPKYTKDQSSNSRKLIKYPLFDGRSDITTYYTSSNQYNKPNILEPFKKFCHFTKPLSERMQNVYEF